MPVPTTIADLNVTASLNSPAGSEAIGTSLDDYIRSHAAIIKQHEADLASTASGKGAALLGRNAPVVPSIAALRALLKTSPAQHAFVTGYYAQGDGGGGAYWLDSSDTTSSDNGGTIIVATDGGRWKLAQTRSISFKQFGAKGDSNGTTGNGTDDTARIQAAFDWTVSSGGTYTLWIDEGTFRTTAALSVASAIRLAGEGVSPYVTSPGIVGGGSWLYFDHTGRGLSIDGASLLSGISLEKFGTRRNQPAPAGGWTPNAHDYDIYIDNADVYIDDVMLLNPTKGVLLSNGAAGRLEINRLRGQAFQRLVHVSKSFDVVKIHNMHQWPFWQDNSNVHAYTLQNLDAIFFERCDNPMLTNIFTIFAAAGMRFGESVDGKTSKVHLANADFDRGKIGILVDSTVVTGVTGQFANVTFQGESALAGSKAVWVDGDFVEFGITNFSSVQTADQAILVSGSGSKIDISGRIVARFYDQDVNNVAAIQADTGNTIEITGYPDITNAGGTGGRYGGNGDIRVDEWRAYSPTVTATSGTITTLGAVSGLFKRYGNTVDVQIDIAITTNGTGAGAVRATLPTTVSGQFVGVGRDLNVGGNSLTATCVGSSANCDIRLYNNTYPGANGSRLVVNATYRI